MSGSQFLRFSWSDLWGSLKPGLYAFLIAGLAGLIAWLGGIETGVDPILGIIVPLAISGAEALRRLLSDTTELPSRKWRHYDVVLLAVALSAGPAWAQDPEPLPGPVVAVAKITGPEASAPGDLVVLSAEKSVAAAFTWRLVGSDKTFLVVDDGVRLVFASGNPGQYTFALACAKGDTVSLALHTVRIGPPPPPPEPGPDPPGPKPSPDPPQPAGPRDLLIFRESADDSPAQARLWTALRTGSAGEYLKSKDHALSILDDDSEGADGRTAAVIEAWKPEFAGMTLPAMFIVDRKTRKILTKTSLPPATNADDVLGVLRANGG